MSQMMLEWESAHAANLDLYKWDIGEYPSAFREKVIAWHSRHIELEQHRQDAVARASARARR